MGTFQKKQEFFEQGSELEDYEDSEILRNDSELDLESDELGLTSQELEAEEEIGQRSRVPLHPLRTRPLPPRSLRPRPQPAARRPPAYRPKPRRVIRRHPRSVFPHEPVTCICPEKTCPEHGTEYIRWVQSALNDVLGLRLPINGIMGPETRGAVRSFQQREGLPVTGIVGPDIESALIAARGGKSPGAGATKPAEPDMMEPVEPAATPPEPDSAKPATEFDFEWESFNDEFEDAEGIDEIEEEESSVEKRCRERWLKWLATLPAPVQEASRVVKSLDDQDPLILRAIQHGVRDPDYLARLAFYSLGQFGYCPPKGRGLENWRQYRLRAKALLKTPVPAATDVGPRPCVGRAENKRDVARPDAPALDITGRYYFWQDRKPFATVLINQAGRHITMRATLLLGAIDRQRLPDRPYKEYNGDLQADGTFRVFNRDKLTEQGTIFRKDGRLFLQMERPSRSPATELVRVEGRPTLLAPALDLVRSVKQGPLGEVLERHELYPLAPGQIRRIRELVKKSLMDALIGHFFQTSDQKKKYHIFPLMVQQVAKLTKEFHPSDLPLVRLYAREELAFNKWTSPRNVRRSHLDWIQMMTDWVRSEAKPGTYDYADYYKTLSNYLGIRLLGQRYQEKPPHTYELDFSHFR